MRRRLRLVLGAALAAATIAIVTAAFAALTPRAEAADIYLARKNAVTVEPLLVSANGSLHERGGHIRGGPSPWMLDEAQIHLKDGFVYAARGQVRLGECTSCAPPRPDALRCDVRGVVVAVGPDWAFTLAPTARPSF